MKSELINNRGRAKQLMAFDGMQYGLCRPTDIDCSIDFKGKVFIFTELKGGSAPLTVGQKIHLSSLCDAVQAGGRTAIAILAHHDTPDTSHDVRVAEARVSKVYCEGKWGTPEEPTTLNDFIEHIHALFLKGEL